MAYPFRLFFRHIFVCLFSRLIVYVRKLRMCVSEWANDWAVLKLFYFVLVADGFQLLHMGGMGIAVLYVFVSGWNRIISYLYTPGRKHWLFVAGVNYFYILHLTVCAVVTLYLYSMSVLYAWKKTARHSLKSHTIRNIQRVKRTRSIEPRNEVSRREWQCDK